MDFTVVVSQSADKTVVTATGELDVHTAPELLAAVDPIAQRADAALVIDLSQVGFIDSTGLGVLVATLKHVRQSGGSLDVVVTAPRVLKVFALTGLDVVIPLHDSLDGAIAST